ncbi:MFS transporter [Streptomyces sp. TRM66268-LWL]|uniref:MFS transporter n=1 Tax=Streptomyces polyasparticus TaxID=2767826 RepID=A0ABR7S8A0_9ACTN|nr:MFS transporter [Streptomyces polyasparticus]MBC9711691.1 MFS transporter [Streptomyces polyasparticus]
MGVSRAALGREFHWLWASYTVSIFGTWLAFDAFALIAVLVLHSGPAGVSALAAVGPAVAALVAVPLGPWMEFRRKRLVMVGMDAVRCAALLTVPLAYALDVLSLAQLFVVSVVVGAADIAFTAASGATLKSLVRKEDLLVANGRFESTMWTATLVGPPLGGAAVGMFGPVLTVAANAVSFLLSAVGIRAIGRDEEPPAHAAAKERARLGDGFRFLWAHPTLRPLFLNAVLVNALIMTGAPLLAVLMLGPLGFAPWQYGLAFAVPCLGGLLGSRLARRLVPRYGEGWVLRVFGVLRVCWPVGLVFVHSGTSGLVLVMVVEFGLITCAAVFSPVLATRRLAELPASHVTRVLSAWSVAAKGATAVLVAAWGVLASLIGARSALGVAGVLLLATPLLLGGWGRLRRAFLPAPPLSETGASSRTPASELRSDLLKRRRG